MQYSQDLNYFVGKVCTLIVRDINWHYAVEAMMDYFVGKVVNINEYYIWTEHTVTQCKNCTAIDHVVSIAEEQVLHENIPEQKVLIEEFKEKKKFVDIKKLSSLNKS